jgi:hypothetical protein
MDWPLKARFFRSGTTRPRSKGAMDQEQLAIKRDRRRRLTEDDVAQIRAHLQQGKTPELWPGSSRFIARPFVVSVI